MKTNVKKYAVLLACLIIASNMMACSEKAETVDIGLGMGSYTTAQNKPLLLRLLGLSEANAAVSSLKMCFKRLRFKLPDEETLLPETSEDNIDFYIGEVDISSGGAALGMVTIPKGTYRRIEFDLEPDCASGKSLEVVNSNGTFFTNERITIKFSGTFNADVDGYLTLGVQQILDALNAHSGGDLKATAESASGVLTN